MEDNRRNNKKYREKITDVELDLLGYFTLHDRIFI